MNRYFICQMVMTTVFLTGTAMGRTYDAVKDFSISENPNGPWSYGYSSSATEADFIASISAFGTKTSKLEGWVANKSVTTFHPSVEHNQTLGPVRFGLTTVPPDCLHLHPGRSGHRSIVRFTVPGQGTYKVQGTFKALNDRTTTDPHVLVNGKAPMFIKPIKYDNHRSDFSFTQQLNKGDTIDFAVGNGGNGYEADSTGLSATVATVDAVVASPVAAIASARQKCPELVTLSTNHGRQFKAIAANGEERLKRLRTEYVAVLSKLETGAKARGDLDGVLVVRNEFARLEKGLAPSDGERKAMPEVLSKSRTQYEKDLASVMAELQAQQTQAEKQYLADLETLERQLTQKGNIDGAMEVRREREQIAGRVSK